MERAYGGALNGAAGRATRSPDVYDHTVTGRAPHRPRTKAPVGA